MISLLFYHNIKINKSNTVTFIHKKLLVTHQNILEIKQQTLDYYLRIICRRVFEESDKCLVSNPSFEYITNTFIYCIYLIFY